MLDYTGVYIWRCTCCRTEVVNMMGYLFRDTQGNRCAAKIVFMMFSFVFMVKILLSGSTFGTITFETVDYTGMASFLTVLAGIYGWRAQNKSTEVKK